MEQPYTIKESIFIVIQTTVALITFITNTLLIIAIATLRSVSLNYSTRCYLVYLTVAHLMLSVLVILKPYVQQEEVCTVVMTIGLTTAYFIGTGILLLSLDRLITMMRPFTHKLILTKTRVKVTIISSVGCILVLMTSFFLTGQPLPRNGASCNINDIFLTPHQVILFCNIILVLLLMSTVFTTWTLILVKRMNAVVAPVATSSHTSCSSPHPQVQVVSAVTNSRNSPAVPQPLGHVGHSEPAFTYYNYTSPTEPQPLVHIVHVVPAVFYDSDNSPTVPWPTKPAGQPLRIPEAIPSTSTKPSQDNPTKQKLTESHTNNSKSNQIELTLKATVNIPELSLPCQPEFSTTKTDEDAHDTVTIHMYQLPSRMAASNQSNQGPPHQRDPRHQIQGIQRTPNRRNRLMRLLAISLMVILICWPQLEIACTVAAVLDIYGIDRANFDYWRLQLSALAFIEGGIYPVILIALSTELRAAVKSLIFKCCNVSINYLNETPMQ